MAQWEYLTAEKGSGDTWSFQGPTGLYGPDFTGKSFYEVLQAAGEDGWELVLGLGDLAWTFIFKRQPLGERIRETTEQISRSFTG